ncbi:MAG TPA: serine/threonine-protein kinase [Enhygromyxa sp.]|nr:serine/threonine-protein kinase [Enhygromyxa sp.]
MSRESEATAQLAPCPHCGKQHDEDSLRCPATDMLLPLEGRRLDGKFRFLSALGSGGMATVYLAVNERVDREVAIKFLRPEVGRDNESVARFRSEAKAAGRIGNTHICEILDLGESPIGPYIVMERLRGIDLAALIRRQTRLAPGYAVRVVRHALEGLAAAHEAGIVHRDLKPGNVFLHRTDGGETIIKLMDFGVSKFLDGSGEAETASGILLGTPEYMAPEQLEGAHKIGPAADIWAMGAILYRAITGHQVFSGPNLAAVLRAMAVDDVRPLSELVTGVPAGLEQVIHHCLQRDPEARYPSAKALSDALAPFEEIDAEVVPIEQPPRVVELPSSELEQIGDASSSPPTQLWKESDEDASSEPVVAAPVEVPVEAPVEVVARKPGRIWIAVGLLAAVAGAVAVMLWLERERDDRSGDSPTDPAEIVETTGEIATSEQPLADQETGGPTAAEETGGAAVVDESGQADESGQPDETGADEGAAEDTDEAETEGTNTGPRIEATDRPPPPGTTRGGDYITPLSPGAATDLASAKRECEALASKAHAGVSNWSLANPTQLRQFIGNAQVKRSRYWTSALHDGRALVFTLPQGKKASEKADRKIARPLCVAKY